MSRQFNLQVWWLLFFALWAVCPRMSVAQTPPRGVPSFKPPLLPKPAPSRVQGQQVTPQPKPPLPPPQALVRPEDLLRLIPRLNTPATPRYRDDLGGSQRAQDVPSAANGRSSDATAPQFIPLTADMFWMLSREEQQLLLRAATETLDSELNRLNTGANWKKYLGLDELTRAFAAEQDDWPDADGRKQLRELADKFDTVQRTPKYRQIFGLLGFDALRVGLAEYAREPMDRGQRHLLASRSALAAMLDKASSGTAWKEYLQMDDLGRTTAGQRGLDPQPEQPGIRLDPQPEQPGKKIQYAAPTGAALDKLIQLEARFQVVQGNSQYAALSRMAEFEQTRERLAALLDLVTPSDDPRRNLVRAVPSTAESAATAREIDLTGSWTSNLGKVSFRQEGKKVSGTLRFSNGVVAMITGTLQGDTLTFSWAINPQIRGSGELVVTADGNRLAGAYDDHSQQTTGPFNMTRDELELPSPPTIPQ